MKDRIYEAMTAQGLTAYELAKKSGIDKGAISRYLSGKVKPKSDKIHALAVALNVSEAWLMGFDVRMERETPEEEKEHALTVEQQLSETMLAKVIELFHTLDLNQQVHLFEVIRKEEQKLETTK